MVYFSYAIYYNFLVENIHFVKQLLLQLNYFQEHKGHIHLVPTEDDKEAVLAFYQAPTSKKTITLISHYDTVGIAIITSPYKAPL